MATAGNTSKGSTSSNQQQTTESQGNGQGNGQTNGQGNGQGNGHAADSTGLHNTFLNADATTTSNNAPPSGGLQSTFLSNGQSQQNAGINPFADANSNASTGTADDSQSSLTVGSQTAGGHGVGTGIGFGSQGGVNNGIDTTVSFNGAFVTDANAGDQGGKLAGGAAIGFGGIGAVNAGLNTSVQVGYGNQGSVVNGFTTITYGNQSAPDNGITTLVVGTVTLSPFTTVDTVDAAPLAPVTTTTVTTPPPVLPADLSISFAVAPHSAIPGQDNAEAYTLQILNSGPGTVTSLSLSDSLFTQLTPSAITVPLGSSFNATTGVLSGISLATGQAIDFGVSGTLTPAGAATGSLTDTATVQPLNVTDPNQANNTATSTIALNPVADLAISFASAPTNAVPGETSSESYTLQVTNNGPSTVTSITLTDSLLSELTNAQFTLPAGSAFNAATGVLSGISLATGQSLNFGISGTISPAATANGSIIDTATVEPVGVNDTNQANNAATSSVQLNPAADLAISFVAAPESAVPGQANAENYTLQVTNNGPSTVTSITLTDSFLSELTSTHFTIPADSSYNATTGVLSGISLGAGQSLSFGISGTYTPAATDTGQIIDTATVEPVGATDNIQANNSATSTNGMLNPMADLAISFVTAPESAVPGQGNAENYTLQVTNNGPSTVTSITLTDSLLSELTNAHFTLPAGSSFNAATGVLSNISLATGQSLDFGITGTLSPAATATGNIVDTATVEPVGATDSNQANNAATSTLALNPVADLAISFSTPPESAVPGQGNAENYALQVTNNGPSTVTSITLTDSLLSELTNAHFTLPAGSSFNAVTGVLSGISLGTGQSLSFGITGTLSPAATATGNIVDTATVEPVGATDSNQANNTAASGLVLNPTADLAVSFATAPVNAEPGQATAENYTLQVTNNGPSTVTSITLTDSFLSQLTGVTFTPPAGSTYNATTHVLSGITLAAGQSLDFNISGTYTPAGTATGTVTDTATVADPSGVTDPNTANNTATSNIVLNPTADLAVSFATAPVNAEPGQATAENYTLQVTNNGPSTVTSITLTDSFLSQLTGVTFTPPAGSTYNATTHVLSGITLAAGQSLDFNISGTYTPAGTATGTVTDTATVADPSGVTDPNLVNNTATSNIVLNPTADLAVSFATAPVNAEPGQATAENYTLQVTNNGPSTVTSITLTDSFLAQLTNASFTLPNGASYNATTHVLSGITLAAGQSLNFGISGTYTPSATATGTVTDTVTVADPSGVTDPNTANNTATSNIVLNPTADLAVSFATAPVNAEPGQATAENYTLQVTNNGPSTVTSITLTDSFLSQLTGVTFTPPAGSTYNATTHVLSGITLAAGQSLDFNISGTYTPAGTATGTVTDTATVADPSGVTDPNLVNNTATSNIVLNPTADLAVSFATAPVNAEPGQATAENYTLQVTNNGPSTVTSITLTDSFLAQLTNASFTLPNGASYNATTHVLSGITLAAGQSLNFGISGTYTPSATATGTVTDTVTVADPSGVTDPNTANNTATSNIVLNPTADLAVSFATAPVNAEPGQATAENYTLQVTNNGPSTVTSITLTDSFLAQLTNASFTLPNGASYNATTHVLSGITLAAGQSLNFGISGTYTPFATATGTVTDTVTVADPSGVTDPNTANNTATSNIVLNPTADLAVSFATAPVNAEPGQATAENYTLQVTNNGPSTVTSITLTDSFLAQLTNASFTLPNGASYNATTHVLSGITLAAGQSLNFGISGTYTPFATATGTVTDTVTVADPSGVTDPNTANNIATSNIVLNPTADLAVSFATAPVNAEPGQATAENYTLQVTNNGPSTVTSITLTDSFLAQLTNASFTLPNGASYNATTHVLSGITLAAGQSLNFGISGTYTPSATATGTVTDTVTVADPSGVTDPNTANNTATSNIVLNPTADLAVSFATAPVNAEPGQATAENYTLQVTNNGPSTVTSITLTDSFLSQLTGVTFTPPAGSTYNATTHVLSGITLAAGQSLDFNISGTYTPAGTATGTVTDTATVADPSGVTDPNTANNTATSNIVLNPTADLAVSFATAPVNAEPGQATAENYTLQVTNNGPSTVTSITLTDSFLAQLINASFTLPNGASYNATTHVLSGITLAAGQSLNFGISGMYTPSATATGTVTDTVTVADPSGVTDPNTANNTATSNIVLNPTADLAVSFATAPVNAEPGQATAENYTLQVTNNGPSTVTSITLTDSFLSQLTGVTFTPPAGSTYNATTHVLSGITLAAGQSLDFNISGTYTPAGTATGTVTDTATVADPSGVTDPNLVNNTATSNIVLNPTADLAVSFATAPVNAEPGQATAENYTLQVTNNGPSTVTSITLTDSFLAQLTNASFTLPNGASYNATTHVLSGITLAAGQSLNFGISGTYTPSATATGTVTDTVTVADPSGVTDPNTANNTATSNIVLNPTADLAVSFATAPVNAEPGQATAENYTLQVTNNGPSTVTSITLTDSFLAQLTNASFTLPNGASYNATTHVLSGITLAAGQSLNFGISGTYTPFATATGTVTDTVTVADPSGVTDPNTANNIATSNIVLNPTADLAVSFATAPVNAEPGQATAENYTLQVTNNGPSTVTSITLTDSFLSQLTGVTFTQPAGSTYNATTHVLSGITLAAGQSLDFNISGTYTPAGTATGTVTDTATVADPSGVSDPNLVNNTATSNIVLNPTADLAVSFATAPVNAEPGQATAENYTLQVTNNGPSTVTSITLTDSFLSQLTGVTFTPPAGSTYNATTHVLSGITLAAGQSLDFNISGTYTPAGTATGTVTDTATVADPSGVSDPNLVNNTATSNIVLNPTADLAVSFATAPVNAEPGQATAENYTLQVTNNGPSTVTSITLTDSFLSQLTGVTFTPPAGSTYNATTHVLSGITLAAGQSLDFNISGTYTPAGTATGTVTDTATVADPSGVTDPNTANNTATSNIVLNPTADLAVSFATAPVNAEPGQATAENYTLQVTNNGPSTVTSITLTDSFLAQLTNASFTLPNGASYNATTHVLSGITLAAGQSLNFGISGTYTPSATATGMVTDTVTVADPSGVTDPNTANNTATSTIALNPTADLAISYATAPQSVVPGQATAENYTLQITNNGPGTVTSITLTDSFLAQLANAHFTLPNGASYNATTGVLSGITLAAGQSLDFGISGTYTAAATATGSVIDTATVAAPSGVTDPNTANNTVTGTVTLNPQATLAVTITPSMTVFTPGSTETYTITLKNTGPSTAYNVSMTDVLPSQGLLNITSPNLPSGVTFNATTDMWSVGMLAVGATDTFQLTGTIPSGATGSSYTDQVTASASDASSVSAQSSIIPSGIVIAEPDIDTVPAVVGSTTAANVITGADANPHPGTALGADIIDAYGGGHIVSISFGSQTASFNVANQVHTDAQGLSYITLTGTYGTIDMYQSGNYIYTVNSVPTSTTGSVVTDGSLAATSTDSAMQADWAGAGLYAFNLGTSYENSAGHLALSQSDGQVTYDTSGIGVAGAYSGSASPVDQIIYDPLTQQSQALAVDLHTSATQAVVTVSNLFTNEATGEQGLWQAFNSSGVEIGEGLLNAATINYGSSDNIGTATIQVLGANGQAIPFEYLVFTSLPYPSAPTSFNDGVTDDAGDYFVRSIQYTPAPTTANLQDVFGYTVADSNNDQSSTTLTVSGETADLAVSIVSSTQAPVPGESDTFTITVTNNGPAAVTSLALTDTTINGLNTYNQFVNYFQNPVITTANGTYNSTTGTWTGFSIASGQSIIMTITGTVNEAAVGDLINTVTVADTTAGIADPVTANNSAESFAVLSTPAVLTVTLGALESYITPTSGTVAGYAITLTDTGSTNAYGVTVSDPNLIAGGMNPSYVSFSSTTSGITYNAATGTFSVGTMLAGAAVVIDVSVNVPTSITGPTYVTSVTASASDASSVTGTNTLNVINDNAVNLTAFTNILNLGDTSKSSVTLSSGSWLVLDASGPNNLNLSGSSNTGNNAFVFDDQSGLTLSVGSGNNQIIVGNGSGNDNITVGSGNNFIMASQGNNNFTLNATASSNNIIILDNSTTNFSGSDLGVYTIISDGGSTSIPSSITSNAANTIINSSSANGEVFSLSGMSYTLENLGSGGTYNHSSDNNNEFIMAQNSSTTITDGNGNDYVVLGSGKDSVTLGNGVVNVMVGTNTDTISVGVGSSTGSGTIIAGNGANSITVGGGSYTIESGNSSSTTKITAGNGNDIIQVGSGTNTINVGGGIDYITTGSGTENITVAGTGSDFITIGGGTWSITDTATGHTTKGTGAYTTTIGDPVNLSITDVASNPVPVVNGFETFTIQVQNSGPDPATNVQIADLIPAGMTLLSVTTDAGSGETYNSSTGVWTIPTLQDGSTATLTLTAQVETAETLTNTATLVAVGEPNTGIVNQVATSVTPSSTDASHYYHDILGGGDGNLIVFSHNGANGNAQGGAATLMDGLGVYGEQQNLTLSTANNVTTVTTTTADGNSGNSTTQISNIDILNLAGHDPAGAGNANTVGASGNGNSVTLSANDVLNVSNETFANLVATNSAFNQIAGQPGVNANDAVMLINGSSSSAVTFAEGNWTSVGTVTEANGHSYAGYVHTGTNGGEALALISTDITHVLGHT